MREQYSEINITDLIEEEAFRNRVNLDIGDLVSSIRENGQLIPIIVRPRDGKFQLISGYRRVASLRKLGRKKVQAKILNVSDAEARRISLLENLERNDLTGWDQVSTAAKFRDQGVKSSDIAEAFGVSIRTIQRYLVVAKAPNDFRKALERDDITVQQAYEAIVKGIPLSEIIKRGRSVRYLRGLSKKGHEKENIRIQHKHNGEIMIYIRYKPNEMELNNVFGEIKEKLKR